MNRPAFSKIRCWLSPQGLALLLICAGSLPAAAHVTLITRESAPGSYRGVLQINHGCGTEATTEVRVRIPEGAVAVKPMPKPGWSVEIIKGPYAKAAQLHGHSLTEGGREIVWSKGTLPDDQYDEFTFVGTITPDVAGTTLYFPVVQRCANGELRWTDVPAPGQSARDLKAPAPALWIVPTATAPMQNAQQHDHGTAASGPIAPQAREATAGSITVTAAWTCATPGGAKIASGYLTIANKGTSADRLVSATSARSGRIEIHEMSMTNGVMQMRPVAGPLEIKPGESVVLKPGGYHVMFMDLKMPLKEGESLPATLQFEKAGALDVTFSVGAIGAGEAPHKH